MRMRILFLMLFVASYSFSQSVNNFKAVIIPVKYDFLNLENQYRLQTLTKVNLQKAGFTAFYNNEYIPSEFNDRCSLLYLDVKKESTFFVTKLVVVFKDCNSTVVFRSVIGESKQKEYRAAYVEALNEAFKSVYELKYKYNGAMPSDVRTYVPSTPSGSIPTVTAVTSTVGGSTAVDTVAISGDTSILYAQPTSYGYQLIDSDPKVVMKVYKTSNPNSYMAKKGDIQGTLFSKDNQWFFEYYQGDTLVSEKVAVKF